MVNLLNNAIKYTPRGGWVAVQVCVDDRRQVAAIDVRDSGIGISTEDLPCIFEKFYRSPSGSKMSGGTGLGLPLTKYIIEKIHGGKLSVTSEIGKGSTFSFELPLVQ
jgi:signal transduction histidine kinase